jgi:hypothetical protein
MEIVLYTNKQILGGILPIIIIIMLFGINLILMNNNDGINLSYFISPIVLTICIITILYITAQKKSIEQILNKYSLPNDYNFKNCPRGYIKKQEGSNIECISTNPSGTGTGSGSDIQSGPGSDIQSGLTVGGGDNNGSDADCELGSWSKWGSCTSITGSCGSDAGIEVRTRSERGSAIGNGSCASTNESKPCNIECPEDNINCVMSTWELSGSCVNDPTTGSTGSDAGLQRFIRTAITQQSGDGSACGTGTKVEPCELYTDYTSVEKFTDSDELSKCINNFIGSKTAQQHCFDKGKQLNKEGMCEDTTPIPGAALLGDYGYGWRSDYFETAYECDESVCCEDKPTCFTENDNEIIYNDPFNGCGENETLSALADGIVLNNDDKLLNNSQCDSLDFDNNSIEFKNTQLYNNNDIIYYYVDGSNAEAYIRDKGPNQFANRYDILTSSKVGIKKGQHKCDSDSCCTCLFPRKVDSSGLCGECPSDMVNDISYYKKDQYNNKVPIMKCKCENENEILNENGDGCVCPYDETNMSICGVCDFPYTLVVTDNDKRCVSPDGTDDINADTEDLITDVDCVLGSWSKGVCEPKNGSCGIGVKTINRDVLTSPEGNGKPCDIKEKNEQCYIECDIDCIEEIKDRSECKFIGQPLYVRTRESSGNGTKCEGKYESCVCGDGDISEYDCVSESKSPPKIIREETIEDNDYARPDDIKIDGTSEFCGIDMFGNSECINDIETFSPRKDKCQKIKKIFKDYPVALSKFSSYQDVCYDI